MLLQIVMVMLIMGVASFVLGWFAANTRERRALRATRRERQALEQRIHGIGRWVRENWPDEAAAYRRGHTEGYQQGVLQSPELEADAEALSHA